MKLRGKFKDKAKMGILVILSFGAIIFGIEAHAIERRSDAIHVFPGDNIQEALEMAAEDRMNKTVKVHSGEYRPVAMRPALIWFNQKHDGIVLEALGKVILTAANPKVSRAGVKTFPAVVSHVVYFGHGISSNTVMRGFTITGANGYVTDKFIKPIEPDTTVPKNLFFFTDGGGIKIFGQSSPTIEEVEVVGNYATPCGGGVSVQQEGKKSQPVIFRNCIFRSNRAQVTGAAVDLLEGSNAVLTNCLFVGNVSNTGIDSVSKRSGEVPFMNSGVLTIFHNSHALVQNCTFTGNRNGVDDMGGNSSYLNCIFYKNEIDGGFVKTNRYELDLKLGGRVQNCYINGALLDPEKAISAEHNVIHAPDPEFDEAFVPKNGAFKKVGYRPGRTAAHLESKDP